MVILDDVDGYPCPPCMCIAKTGTTRDFTIGLRGSQILILFQLVILQYVPKLVVMDRIEQDKYRTGQLTFKYDIQLSKQTVCGYKNTTVLVHIFTTHFLLDILLLLSVLVDLILWSK